MLFTPVIRTSTSIPRTLLQFSIEKKIDLKLLDFELISHETLVKSEANFEHRLIKNKEDITQKDMNNPTTVFRQEYDIKIIPLIKEDKKVKLSIATDKLKTKAIMTIKKGSIFVKHKNLLKDLKKDIWKKKLKAGLFINIFEDKLNAQLKKLASIIPFDKPLQKDIKLIVALGDTPKTPIDSKFEKLYELKPNNSESIIDGVNEGELIARYILPKDGISGRACNGEYINVRAPRTAKQPTFDNTIIEKKLDECIEYYANIDGYVVLTNNKIRISKSLKLAGADFKSTGAIDAGDVDTDISVHIGHTKSHNEDAIGSGVNIDVKELNVEGSIAANVKISTKELNVDAQTHKDSIIEVENTANIHLHRGELSANEANIKILEGGKVTASKSINIREMVGGVAIAPIVKIDRLMSNATIIASELIEINNISGENNKLIIDPSIKDQDNDPHEIEKEMRELMQILEIEKSALDLKLKEHIASADRIKTFQDRISRANENGKTPMKQDVIRVKQYEKKSDQLQEEQDVLDKKDSDIKLLEESLDKIYNKDLYAKIKSKTPYDGHTRVVFINMHTKEEISFMPEGKIETISLVLNEDNERIISKD